MSKIFMLWYLKYCGHDFQSECSLLQHLSCMLFCSNWFIHAVFFISIVGVVVPMSLLLLSLVGFDLVKKFYCNLEMDFGFRTDIPNKNNSAAH